VLLLNFNFLENDEIHKICCNFVMQRVTTETLISLFVAVLSEAWKRNSSFKGLKSPRHRWQDNISMDLQEVGCGVWTGSSWLSIGAGSGQLCMR
jgi:hypothetical protein